MSKVLVKGYEYQIGPDGKPQMYYNLSRGRRDNQNGARGRTRRSQIGSKAGGALGVLAALGGESRSLGGFAGQMFGGYQQGSMLGRGLADTFTSRNRQKRADILEGEKQARLQADVESQLRGERELDRRRNVLGDTGVYEYQQGEPVSPMKRTLLGRLGGRDMRRFGRDVANFQSQQQAAAAERAEQQRELDKRGFRGTVDEFFTAARNMPSREAVNVASSLQNVQPPPVANMAPIGPLPASNLSSAAAQVQRGDLIDPAAHLGPLGDPDAEITPNQQGQQGQQGQQSQQSQQGPPREQGLQPVHVQEEMLRHLLGGRQ